MSSVMGHPRMVVGPEEIRLTGSNKAIPKWTFVLDNGSELYGYTKRLADAIASSIDQEVVFDVDDKNKVLRATRGGTIIYERKDQAPVESSADQPKKEWVDTTPAQNARHAVGSAVALVGQLGARNANGDRMSDDDVVITINKFAQAFFEMENDLSK